MDRMRSDAASASASSMGLLFRRLLRILGDGTWRWRACSFQLAAAFASFSPVPDVGFL
jgi:hypothetical protein